VVGKLPEKKRLGGSRRVQEGEMKMDIKGKKVVNL
jgi:hypothetical protein